MTTTVCYECGKPLDTEEAHTYHAEGCPMRNEPHVGSWLSCYNRSGCGEDVHAECCPTCR